MPPARSGTIRAVRATTLSVSSRAIIDACARLGLDTDQILNAAKLDRAVLQNPDARIALEQMDALWKKAYELSNDPNLALHAIEVLPFGAYRVIDFLAATLTNRLLHGPSQRLREAAERGESEVLEAARALWIPDKAE